MRTRRNFTPRHRSGRLRAQGGKRLPGFSEKRFFRRDEAICWVLSENGVWISALRTCRIRSGDSIKRGWRHGRHPGVRSGGDGAALGRRSPVHRRIEIPAPGHSAVPRRAGSCDLYEDAEDGYGYEQGQWAVTPIRWWDDQARVLRIGKRQGAYPGMIQKRQWNVILPNGNRLAIRNDGSATDVDLSDQI